MWTRRLVGIICCALLLSFSDAVVGASSGKAWVEHTPELERSISVFASTDYRCPVTRIEVKVEGLDDFVQACVFGGTRFQFASYLNPHTGKFEMGLATRFDDRFRMLEGICEQIAGCIYAPASDTLLARTYVDWPYLGVAVYQHASERVSAHRIAGTSYSFDATHPSTFVKDDTGKPLRTGSMNVSSNGQWAAIELRNDGVIRVNLETLEMRRISDEGPKYDVALDPRMELAISDDGAIVVITGLNAGFSVIAVDSECGEPLVPPIRRIFLEKSSRCQQTGNVISNFVSGYRYAAHPLLNAQGTVLKVQVIDHEYRRHLLALKPWGFPSAATLEYLALGDSFTSGEGETNDGHYLLGTNREFDRCHLSDRSYPFLIAAAQGIAIHHVESVACSGARMNDIVATSPYEGQGNRLGEGGWNWNSMLIKQRQEEALEGFFPGRILQSQFVDAYQPRAITIGIGGNDAGFMDKLRACVMPGTCEWVSNPALRMRVGEEIARQFAALRELFQRILSLSPLSQLFVFGYPQIVTDEGRGCDLLTAHLLNLEEREFMSQGVHYLNQVIRAAAQSVNVPYIDIESSFHGARLCEIAKKSAVNGVRLGDDLAPIASLPMLRIIGNESFHPTPYGHELIAATFRRLVPDLRENTTCECVPSTTLPPTPAYWTGQNTADEPALWAESFANVEYDSGEKRLAVYVPEGSLLPHSVAHLTIAGREGELEIVTVGSKGEIVANIVLPQSLQRGYHTVHVYGTSFSGERINLYQAIAVSEAEPMEEPVRVDTGKDSNLDHEQSLPKETPPHLAPRIIPLNTEATQVLGITTFHMRDTVQGRYSELVVPGIIIILCVFVFIYIRGRGG